ncbi:MAG: hypothetical protein JW973_03765 [Bacteroidales bacterium]|nr:hypothetical protein [Bacteroidales bacterium]
MMRYAFLIYHKEYEAFLDAVRTLGIVHVIEREFDETINIREKKELINKLNHVISFLKKRNPVQSGSQSGDGMELFEKVQAAMEELEANKQKLQVLKKDIALLEPWGNYTAADVERLHEAELTLRLFTCPVRKFNESWKSHYAMDIISEKSGNLYFAMILEGQDAPEIDAEEVKLSSSSLDSLRLSCNELENKNDIIEKSLDSAASQIELLEQAKKDIFSDLEYEKVRLSTGKEVDNRLMLLEGWIPEEKSPDLSSFCDQQNILYIADKPAKSDNVPVLLRNNRFARLFEPIGRLYALPAYAELDLTAFFAPFFMIFFGFCLGDAGYGLTILILVTLYKIFKAKPDIKPLLTLCQYLGAATILMGMVGGTVFGMNLLDTGYVLTETSLEFLKENGMPDVLLAKMATLVGQHFALRDDFIKAIAGVVGTDTLREYKTELIRCSFSDYAVLNKFRHLILDPKGLFNLALVMGTIQILFGMGMKAANMIKQKGFIHSVSTISWLFFIIGLIIMQGGAAAGYIDQESANLLSYVITGIGLSGILFFNDPSTHILMSFGKGLFNIYSMVTGVFGDLLSYIRLFALGISSSILGLVIDKIAWQFLGISYIGPVIFVIFLLIGHSMVLLLSSLGAFVHPLRLTFVEFYKNSGFAGGGKEYNPFSK